MPTDPGFWLSLLTGMSEGAKIIVLLLIVIAVLGGRALQLLGKKLEQTKEQATLAAVRSEPTSNGFAAGTQHQLTEISEAVIRIENTVDKLSGRVAELERPSLLPHLTPRRRRSGDTAAEQED